MKTVGYYIAYVLLYTFIAYQVFYDEPFISLEKESLTIELPEHESINRNFSVEFTEEEFLCMQKNIFFEARNQSVEGMKAVALVTMNRVQSLEYPNTVCEVVYQDSQFSWVGEAKKNLDNTVEREAWEQIEPIALAAMNGTLDNFIPGVTLYHATYVNPYWNRNLTIAAQVDDHIFYLQP